MSILSRFIYFFTNNDLEQKAQPANDETEITITDESLPNNPEEIETMLSDSAFD